MGTRYYGSWLEKVHRQGGAWMCDSDRFPVVYSAAPVQDTWLIGLSSQYTSDVCHVDTYQDHQLASKIVLESIAVARGSSIPLPIRFLHNFVWSKPISIRLYSLF